MSADNVVVKKSYLFALRIIRLVNCLPRSRTCDCLPRSRTCDIIGKQLLRSGTSIGANVEEAQSGYSRNDLQVR